MRNDYLFCERDLYQVLQNNLEATRRLVDEIPVEQFNRLTDDEIFSHILSRLEILPLELHEGEQSMEHSETQIDVSHDPDRFFSRQQGPFYVPGLRVSVSIPFTGEPQLWKCKPSTFTTCPPSAKVYEEKGRDQCGYIELIVNQPSDAIGDGARIKNKIESAVQEIKRWVEFSKKDVLTHNSQLPERIKQQIQHRRDRLASHDSVLKMINIPLKKKNGAPEVPSLTLRKKIIRPLPPTPKGPPDHTIRDEDYDYILNIIRHEGRSFETTPFTFAKHGEEELRDIILAHLNGHFEGQATGEAFRKKGKTDIRIEFENRAAFVAECKIWKGVKQAIEAIDQLLGYLTWKDCKSSLVIFNTNVAGFSELQKKLPEAIKGHTGFLGEIRPGQAGEWRFRFKAEDDDNRHIILHVFLFNLYVK